MNTGKRSTAITEALATPQLLSMTRQVTRSQKGTTQQEEYIFFNVGISNLEADFDQVDELQAGNSYKLVIACDKSRSTIDPHLKQDEKLVADAFSLILSFNYDRSVTTPITPAKEIFPFEKIFNEFPYAFTIPIDFPTCNLSIILKLKTPLRSMPVRVVEYSLPVCGQQNTFQLEILKVSQINQRLPEKTAILLAEISEQSIGHKQRIYLRGWDKSGQQLDDKPLMNVVISVEELQTYQQREEKRLFNPDEILNRLTRFSRSISRALIKWLSKLLDSYNEQFNLVIVDLTQKEIPWELLELDPSQYLGSYARVVRWLPTQFFKIQRELVITPENHEGTVISYLDEQLGPNLIHHEKDALQRLVDQPYPSLHELKQRLTSSLEEIGLIYIGCHGNDGRRLGRLQQNVPELSSIMLERIYERKTPGLTVFINACESARIIKGKLDDPGNFVETFLAYGADGFIGTLARVDVQTASLLASQLLLSASQPGGVQIAELLRILRKNAIMQLENLKKDNSAQKEDYYRVLDTFMYVYYGNPLAYLQLHPRKEPGQ